MPHPPLRRMRRPSLLILLAGIVVAGILVATAAIAEPVKRRRRAPPPTSGSSPSAPSEPSSEPSDDDDNPPPRRSPGAKSPAKPAAAAGSLDERIAATQARIREHRRSIADAVKRAGLRGTAMHQPGGVSSGTAVDYTTVHAKKEIRGQVKATAAGDAPPATISASRAR